MASSIVVTGVISKFHIQTADDRPVDPRRALVIFGTVVIDDFTPATGWPPGHEGRVDAARLHWLEHPDLLAAEEMLCPEMSTIVGTRRR